MSPVILWVDGNLHDVRQQELERQKAQSHAAKVTHHRRKSRRSTNSGAISSARPTSVCQFDHTSYTEARSTKFPTPTPWKGNSDPFRSFGIEVTPRINEAFRFLVCALIPGSHITDGVQVRHWVRNFLPERSIRGFAEALNDEWLAIEAVLPLRAAISRLSGLAALQAETLQSKVKVMRKLRSEIPKPRTCVLALDHMIGLTKTLFATATFENNLTEARTHGRALRQLLDLKTSMCGIAAIDIDLVWTILYYDAQISHQHMEESIFDVDDWAPKCLRLSSKALSELMEDWHRWIAEALDPCLDKTPRLKEICVEIYQVLWLWCRSTPISVVIDGSMMNVYITCRHNILQLKLSNHVAQIRTRLAGIDTTNGHTPSAAHHLHVEAVLSLSLLGYLASFVGNPSVGGQYLWPRAARFVSLLRYHLETVFASVKSSEHATSLGLVVFSSWVGASWERNSVSLRPLDSSFWFSNVFARAAALMGLRNWRAVREILNGFVPCEFAKPDGAIWVDAVIHAHEAMVR